MSEQAGFGRVAEDGTVFVRTASGERAVGSWQAGSPEEGLAFYARKYDELATEVALLARRLAAGMADPRATRERAEQIRGGLDTAAVVGDLDALAGRLDALVAAADERSAAAAEERARATAEATAAKERLASEAEALATSSDWKGAGERLRAMGEEWRGIRGVPKAVDGELWGRVARARREFDRRRREHFAALDAQRKESQERKERLVSQAEALASSTDWGPTAARLKELMADWKRAGRASREAEDELWSRFRAAQDAFFARRSEVFAERDAELRGNLERKEALLAEAEALDPEDDPEGAQRRLREVQVRWDAIGRVPREAVDRLERRLMAVGDRVRAATDARWRQSRPQSNPLLAGPREAVAKLEARLARAQESGDAAAAQRVERELAAKRDLLAQLERAAR